MTWWEEFPAMAPERLTALKKAIDGVFVGFTRSHGAAIEAAFDPLKQLLIFAERLAVGTPWPVVLALVGGAAWAAGRTRRIAAGAVAGLALIGWFGMWDDAMKTIAMILVATLCAVLIGLPVGVLMARSRRLRAVLTPVLDVMQTLPSFVYLIPVVMLLGIGKVPGLIAVIVYALPPMIRLTDLGIREVDTDTVEAATAFGAGPWQLLRDVELPLALPTIMAGVNQTLMMALSMVVVAAMIGVQGLGQPVLKAIANQSFTLGLFNGFAIVGIAVIFDRISQSFGHRLQRRRGADDG